MRIERRTFLAAAAAGPLVYGLDDLLGRPGDAEWFDAALRRMKETRRYGIVLLVGDDARTHRKPGMDLLALLDGPSTAAHAIFAQAVFICMPNRLARGRLRAEAEHHNRILLDPDGRRVASDTVGEHTLRPERFASSFSLFLHGRAGERLSRQARAIQAALPDDVRNALSRLNDDSVEVRAEASDVVLRHADRMVPYLVHQGQNGETAEFRSRCRGLVEAFFRASEENRFGPRLPYGTSRVTVSADPCPACGLAVAPVRSRKLLRFLTK